jgi:hypothetical protein
VITLSEYQYVQSEASPGTGSLTTGGNGWDTGTHHTKDSADHAIAVLGARCLLSNDNANRKNGNLNAHQAMYTGFKALSAAGTAGWFSQTAREPNIGGVTYPGDQYQGVFDDLDTRYSVHGVEPIGFGHDYAKAGPVGNARPRYLLDASDPGPDGYGNANAIPCSVWDARFRANAA